MRPEARMLLAAAPTPTHAARLTHTQLVAVLRRAGRVRLLDAEATRLQQILRADYLHQPVSVEHAMGRHADRVAADPERGLPQRQRPRRGHRRPLWFWRTLRDHGLGVSGAI